MTIRHSFTAAATAIGMPDLHPHELRHAAASLAIASGADIKVVQKKLGHASATMTLDTYGHLFDDRLDEVATAMEAARDSQQAKRAKRATLPEPADLEQSAPSTEAPVALVLPATIPLPHAEDLLISVSAGQEVFLLRTPDRIRTGATALRGRRARPLHNGGLCSEKSLRTTPEQPAKL